MKVLHGFSDPATRHGYVAIGNFDGVHRGHQAMFRRLCERASEAGVPAVVVTFDPHPVAVLRPGAAPQPLMTLPDRLAHIAQCGPGAVIVQSTTPQFLQLSARQFFEQIVLGELGARGIVEGENFRFGRGRDGTVQQLAAWCAAEGLGCEVIPPVQVDGRAVSSSVIRRLITEGEVAAAPTCWGDRTGYGATWCTERLGGRNSVFRRRISPVWQPCCRRRGCMRVGRAHRRDAGGRQSTWGRIRRLGFRTGNLRFTCSTLRVTFMGSHWRLNSWPGFAGRSVLAGLMPS